ncbi:hypothetical protein ACEPPN_004223 [Leptodophora sp. 'Broadleaf-Isolate-01']
MLMFASMAYYSAAAVAIFLSIGIYRVSLHPLSKFPGPVLWSISILPQAYYLARGRLPYKIHELHEKYGPVVRLAPSELSFIDDKAWEDIYSRFSGKFQLQKDHTFLRPSTGIDGLIFESKDERHKELRQVFSYGFSELCMKQYETVVLKYVQQLMIKLKDMEAGPVDICQWFNYTLFDITGKLLFDVSFDALQKSSSHPWIQMLFDWVAGAALLGMAQKLWPLTNIITWLIPKKMRDAEISHRTKTKEVLEQCLKRAEPVASENRFKRNDLVSNIALCPTYKDVTDGEILETCRVLLVGGAETMATVVSGTLYYLLCNPDSLEKLTKRLRLEFKSRSEIDKESLKKVPYLSEVIDEGLRLFHPLPGNLRRITPPTGCMISGRFIPGKTVVGVDIYAAAHSSGNFHKPTEFHPERWSKVDLPEEFLNDKHKAMRPFSIGPRNCIAQNLAYMEMQLVLAVLIFSFDIKLLEESKSWADNVKVFGFIQKRELMVKLAQRFI